jgi:RNA polymerase sigma-70 factor (ECF subfamily)
VSQPAASNDGEVVRAVLAGDTERYAELVHRYRSRYARYAARMLGSVDAAEDAVQDAFIRAYDQLKQCREPDNFAGWFFLILRNRCYAERRRDHRVTEGSWGPTGGSGGVGAGGSGAGAGLAELVPSADRADAHVERLELRRAIDRALLKLTAEQRDVFVLKHVEGMSYEQIAQVVGVSIPSLKMRMHRAYDRLREELKEHL